MPAHIDGTRLQQRIVEAVACMPPGSAATGWAALAWLAPRWFEGIGPDGRSVVPVPVAVGDHGTARPRPGVTISEDWLFDDDVIEIDGLPITVPERSVSFEARLVGSDLAATTVVDMAIFHDLVDLAGLAAYARRLGPRPGTLRLARAVSAGDENAWSPPEVRARTLWVAHRGVRPLCNAPIFDRAGNHPAWWVDTSTVARRRALTAEQAARWLAHRRRT